MLPILSCITNLARTKEVVFFRLRLTTHRIWPGTHNFLPNESQGLIEKICNKITANAQNFVCFWSVSQESVKERIYQKKDEDLWASKRVISM